MKKVLFIYFIVIFVTGCLSNRNTAEATHFSKIAIDTLCTDKLSCRAIIIDNDKAWYAANNGKFGYVSLNNKTNFTSNISKDNLKLEFRSIAQTATSVFILSISNPALMYKIDKKTNTIKLVYEEQHEKVFYDSMQFLNDTEGFAVGDPTENCPSFIKTANGGETWEKISCQNLPIFSDGEAFFATSNTNLIIKKNTIWMASGGMKSRIFKSDDKGKSWTIVETPIVQGEAMAGIFTADFYDENYGFITGGNYDKPLQNFQNKAFTTDGGKTWKLTSDNRAFGYASCVQYIPNSPEKSIVVVANDGIYFLRNINSNWTKISDVKDLYTIRFIENKTAIAAGKDKILRLNFK